MKPWVLSSLLFIAAAAGLLAAAALYRENQALRAELTRRVEIEAEALVPAEAEPGIVDTDPIEPPPPEPASVDEPVRENRPQREDRFARFRRMMDDPNVREFYLGMQSETSAKGYQRWKRKRRWR